MPAYLDYNASTPVDERVLTYMMEVYRSHYGNADSRTHMFGMAAKELVSASRNNIASILEIPSTDLFFTSGATESNNLSVIGLLDYALNSGKTHFITTAIEHKSVLESMKYLEQKGCTVDYVAPDASGRVKPEQILSLVNKRTLLISVMHVNSETGIIQPVREIGESLSELPVFFHVDATQSFGRLNDELRLTKYDLLSFSAHKVGGPQGIGALVMKRGKNYLRPPIQPLLHGGQQERGFRPGTTPVALVAGFAKAAELAEIEAKDRLASCHAVRQKLIDALAEVAYNFNGDQAYCIPSTANISFKGVDAEGIFVALKDSYAISNGSACNSGSHAPSYVLTAMGLPDSRINEAVRISWGPQTNTDFTTLTEYIRSMQ